MGSRFPTDKINLRLILVTGKTKEFIFSPNDSAADIAQYVFDNWPQEWAEEGVSKAEILRLIYQGRFLHGNVTLGALQLPLGRTTVMHLVPRENLPEPNSQVSFLLLEWKHWDTRWKSSVKELRMISFIIFFCTLVT
ncbi:ubiquitin-like protein 3 isoform X1 [Limulus polyphemus]|uniref:Ubiquitin-like protein 3 isoform X1 n=1 Tax=Limulus polyphemus TaxID=6850 RepID=A0ABM1T3V5_LIMPO|nr:ubiquitin-like protein 3 isoform X1 [Limulus polyphemus]